MEKLAGISFSLCISSFIESSGSFCVRQLTKTFHEETSGNVLCKISSSIFIFLIWKTDFVLSTLGFVKNETKFHPKI